MPTYEYKCANTVHPAPVLVSVTRAITEAAVTPKCPDCDRELVRAYTAPAVTFNGTGWGREAR